MVHGSSADLLLLGTIVILQRIELKKISLLQKFFDPLFDKNWTFG
jgi:hypothetical protein